MKRFLLLLFFVLSLVSIYAQQDTVFFRVGVNCPGTGTILFNDRALLEGQLYTVEPHTFTAPYQNLQNLYDALVGTTFQIEDGALNENIKIDWILNNLDCTNGNYNLPPNGALLLFNSYYMVSHKVNGVWQEVTGSYTFQNDKKAVLSIANTAHFNAFRLGLPLYVNQIAFVFMVGGTYIPSGITLDIPTDTTDVNAYWVIKASHLSYIVGGQKDKLTGIDDNKMNNSIPSAFQLKQNYPNPFNPSTSIEFSVPQRSNIEVNVYNILGVKVATLFKGTKDAGNYRIPFDASGLSSGIYIYELKSPDFIQSRKMLLLK